MTIKKNTKTQISFARLQSGIQLFLTITSVVIVIASLWIASFLSPIKQDVAILANDVTANKVRIEDQNDKIDEIDAKLDRLLIHFSIQD